MSDYTCPNCRGQFPIDNSLGSRDACPWCGQEFGEYDPPEQPQTISRVVKDGGRGDYDGEYGVLGRLFGWGPEGKND